MYEGQWIFRIHHMADAIARILEKTKNVPYGYYVDDDDLIDITCRQFQILGEAARHIPDDIKEKYPDINWRGMIGMRHFIIHEYIQLNYKVIWNVINKELPLLLPQLQTILTENPS